MANSDALITFEQKILGLCSGTVGLAHWLSEKYGLTPEDFSTPVNATVFSALQEIDARDGDGRTAKWIVAYQQKNPDTAEEGVSRGIEKRLVKALEYCGATTTHALRINDPVGWNTTSGQDPVKVASTIVQTGQSYMPGFYSINDPAAVTSRSIAVSAAVIVRQESLLRQINNLGKYMQEISSSTETADARTILDHAQSKVQDLVNSFSPRATSSRNFPNSTQNAKTMMKPRTHR